jgi:predicted HD superfamily hydrolase involved in NAD metabolism
MAETVTYEAAEQAVAARLGEESLAHSRRVSETAAELAEAYGVDSRSARMAGLLHDWDRDRTAACIDVTEVDLARPYLLHARTGALGLERALPGLDRDILDAVARHTMGATEMSELDKIVFVADMVEPSRVYKGVDKLRSSVGRASLDELFEGAYAVSLKHLIRRRKRIHPKSVEVWNALVGRDRE